MHRDIVHVPGPNQKRIRRIGRALVAVSAAFHHQPQVILAGKIHGLGNVVGISCRDRVDAWPGRPCVDPSQGLCESGVIADMIWVSQTLQETPGCSPRLISLEWRKRKIYRDQASADCIIKSLPGRRRRPCGIGRTAPTERHARHQASRQNRQERRSDCFQECSLVHDNPGRQAHLVLTSETRRTA
jgi:hypothetical protein